MTLLIEMKARHFATVRGVHQGMRHARRKPHCVRTVSHDPQPRSNTVVYGDRRRISMLRKVVDRGVRWCVSVSVSTRERNQFNERAPLIKAAVQRTGACRRPDRARDPACVGCLQRASGQRSGRRLMRAKRRAPISCRHRCRRKEPLPSDQRSGRVERRRSAPIFRAGRDNFRDNRGDSRRARKSRSRLYLAFSPR